MSFEYIIRSDIDNFRSCLICILITYGNCIDALICILLTIFGRLIEADIFVVCGAVLGAVYYMWFYEKYDKKGGAHGESDAPSE